MCLGFCFVFNARAEWKPNQSTTLIFCIFYFLLSYTKKLQLLKNIIDEKKIHMAPSK